MQRATRRWCTKLLWSGALLLIPTCFAAPPEASAGTAATIDATALVSRLKRATPARTAYTEIRFSGLLDRPLVLRGELEYLGPAQLGKRVDTPYREQTTVANGEASVRRGDRAPRTFSLNQAPELEGFLRGFAALLGGDAAALARDFELVVHGDMTNWQLTMKPRDARLARRIRIIEVDGTGTTPRCFQTSEADGDSSILLVDTLATTVLPVRPVQSQIDALCRGIKTR